MTAEEIDAAGRRLKKALMERDARRRAQSPPGLSARGRQARRDHQSSQRHQREARADGRRRDRLEIPRDRDGTFEPQLIPKHARRLAGFDDKVLALYARGLPVREIQKFLAEIYAIDVSPDLISEVTDAVVAEVTEWQARPLDRSIPSSSSTRSA